ncbi:hypothetical protein NN561_018429 [Cricetulus griseus]
MRLQELLPSYQLHQTMAKHPWTHHSPDPRPSCPKITYTSAFTTCVGGELVLGWKRCGFSVLGLSSRSLPQPQPLLLRSIVLPSLAALPASSQLACIFRAAWGAGHGFRWGVLVPALGDKEGSWRLPLQAASRWQWGFLRSGSGSAPGSCVQLCWLATALCWR